MILMSLLYLRVSENSLRSNHFTSFQNDVNTIVSGLEQSTYISIQWLSGLEARNTYIIYVTDNDKPFLYNTLKSNGKRDSGEVPDQTLSGRKPSGLRYDL